MSGFLAKSEPKETIASHTEALLIEYERLGTLYPQLKADKELWGMLELVCFYHDLGKINGKFQIRVKNGGRKLLENELHHGILSAFCLNAKQLKKYNWYEDRLEIYAAILFHHYRENLLNFEEDDIKAELSEIKNDFYKMMEEEKTADIHRRFLQAIEKYVWMETLSGEYAKLSYRAECYREFKYDILSELMTDRENEIEGRKRKKSEVERAITYIFLKGLLNRIDYAASAGIPVEQKNDFLESGLTTFMDNMNAERIKSGKEKTDWNALQRYMMVNSDENIIVVAQTGMGKTEAALWWIGNHKGIFTLPIRTAINSIYDRIKNTIIKNENVENRLGLLHGESFEYYMNLKEEEKFQEELTDLQEYYTKTRQISLPLTITTLDQIFLFVFRHIGYEERLATMAYSKVVVDEIQMYGPDLTAFLIVGLEMIQKMGGRFAILTATFPDFIKDLMKERRIKFKEPIEKFVDKENIRHAVKKKHEEMNAKFIFEEFKKNEKKRILVICNTVKQCQTVYRELKDFMSENADKLYMLHAKFIRKDRSKLENDILNFTKEGSGTAGIWITSSIAEASLDIDFDLLITELSDINSFFQRLGRCFRRRFWQGEGYNCVVFDGGEKLCSGVGNNMPISEELFLMSKKEIEKRMELRDVLLLDEEMKLEIIENLYSTKNIKKCAPIFFNEVKEMMKKPELFSPNEKERNEAIRSFRNILSYPVIPSPVFNEFETEIREIEERLASKGLLYEERVKLKQNIRKYTLDVEVWVDPGKRNEIGTVRLSKNERISIMRCKYDSRMGFEKIVYDGAGEVW